MGPRQIEVGGMRALAFPWKASRTLLVAMAMLVFSTLLVSFMVLVSSTSVSQDQQLFDVDAANQWNHEGYLLPQGKVRPVRVPGSTGVKHPHGRTVHVLYPPPATSTASPTWCVHMFVGSSMGHSMTRDYLLSHRRHIPEFVPKRMSIPRPLRMPTHMPAQWELADGDGKMLGSSRYNGMLHRGPRPRLVLRWIDGEYKVGVSLFRGSGRSSVHAL